MYGVDAGAGLEILRKDQSVRGGLLRLETALIRVRTKAGLEKAREELGGKPEGDEEDQLAKAARTLESGACAIGSRTAEALREAVANIDDEASRIEVKARWVRLNGTEPAAAEIGLETLQEAVGSKNYTPSGALYGDVAHALGHRKSETGKRLAELTASQEKTWLASQPRSAAVRVGMRIALQMEQDEDSEAARKRRNNLFWTYIEGDNELSEESTGAERLECAAVMVTELPRWSDMDAEELYTLCQEEIKKESRRVYEGGAEQLEILRETIKELAPIEAGVARSLVEQMNTGYRRKAGAIMLVREICRRGGDVEAAADIATALEDGSARRTAVRVVTDHFGTLMTQKQEVPLGAKRRIREGVTGREGYYVAKHWLSLAEEGEEAERWRQEIKDELARHEGEVKRIHLLELLIRMMPGSESWQDEVAQALSALEGATQRQEMAHGRELVLRIATEVLVGLTRQGAQTATHEQHLTQAIRKVTDRQRRLGCWFRLAIGLGRAEQKGRAQKYVEAEILPRLRSEGCPIEESEKWYWALGAALAAGTEGDVNDQGIVWPEEEIERSIRWGAFWYVVTGEDPSEQMDYRLPRRGWLTMEQCERVLSFAERTTHDGMLWRMMEHLADGVTGPDRKVTKNQSAELAQRMRKIARTKLPSADGVPHAGYRILVQAEAAKVEEASNAAWREILDKVPEIGNTADEVYVLIKLAERSPQRGRGSGIREEAYRRALEELQQVEFEVDELDRAFVAGYCWSETDIDQAKAALQHAAKLVDGARGDMEEQTRNLFALAYRLEPEWMRTLGNMVEVDPARKEAQKEIKNQVAEIENQGKRVEWLAGRNGTAREAPEQLPSVCREGLTELIRRRQRAPTYERIATVARNVQKYSTEEAYPILAWVTRSLWDRAGNEAGIIRRLEEVWRGICTALHYYEEMLEGGAIERVPRGWRLDETLRTSIHILPGQRARGVAFIQGWLERMESRTLLIADPYFSVEHVTLIQMILNIREDTEIRVLTSGEGFETKNTQAFVEAFKTKWRALSLEPLGEVEMTVVKLQGGNGILHDRYLIGDWEGMSLGRGWADMGRSESRLARFDEYEFAEIARNLRTYADQSKRQEEGRDIRYERLWLRG